MFLSDTLGEVQSICVFAVWGREERGSCALWRVTLCRHDAVVVCVVVQTVDYLENATEA